LSFLRLELRRAAAMADRVDTQFLYRKLLQTRRLIKVRTDPIATDGLKAQIAELERKLAEIEAREAEPPTE
jgi:hypothetical protein